MKYYRAWLDRAHAEHARLHALKRLRERFDIDLDLAGLRVLEAELITGRYRWVAAERLRQSITFEVPMGAVTTYPLFSVRLWAVVTFLQTADVIRPAVGARPF